MEWHCSKLTSKKKNKTQQNPRFMVIMRTCIYINKISFVTFEKFNTCKGNFGTKQGLQKFSIFINA